MLFPIDAGAQDPAKLAFQMCETGEQVSFAQLDARANQVAQLLRACGVAPGEHVALLMKNDRRFLEACFGMDRCGVYYTTISTRLTPWLSRPSSERKASTSSSRLTGLSI